MTVTTWIRGAAAIVATSVIAVAAPATAQAAPVQVIGPGTGVIAVSSIVGGNAEGLACTTGFIGQKPDGTRVGVIAGHCGKAGQQVLVNHYLVGRIDASSSPAITADRVFLNEYAPDWATFTVNPALATLSPSGPNVSPARSGIARVGDKVCSQGVTTGWHCGTVVDVEANYIGTTIAAQQGDSGGPLIRTSDNAALGIRSRTATLGGQSPTSATGSLFYDINAALAAAGGLALVTAS